MSAVGRATVDKRGYRSYINSDAWRDVRRSYLRSDLPKACYVCEKDYRPGFHFHHRTYKNLGAEFLRDIVPVCESCHERIHTIQRETGLHIWQATKRARVLLRREVRRGRTPTQTANPIHRRALPHSPASAMTRSISSPVNWGNRVRPMVRG